jgi:hypothetical protein
MPAATLFPGLPFGVVEAVAREMGAAPPGVLTEEDARYGLGLCRSAREQTRKIQDSLRRILGGGVEGKRFVDSVGPAFRAWAARVQEGRAEVKRLDLSRISDTLAAELLAEFEAFFDDAEEVCRIVQETLDLATAPATPLDMDRVRAAEEAFARGETRILGAGFMTKRD